MRLASTQLSVRWSPLNLEEARGFITHYTVTAEPVSTTQTRQQTEGVLSVRVLPNTTSVVMHGLSSALTYWITVSANTVVGTSTNNSKCLANPSGTDCYFKGIIYFFLTFSTLRLCMPIFLKRYQQLLWCNSVNHSSGSYILSHFC